MSTTSQSVNVNINFATNASTAQQQVAGLGTAVQGTTASTVQATSATNNFSRSLATNGQSVLDNGGAMGILNDLTGGYAMIVKDAFEALELFTGGSRANTAATTASTTATSANAVATGGATVATNSWTAALLANPVVAVTAAVVALGVAVYAVTKYFADQAAELKTLTDELNYNKIATDNLNASIEAGNEERAGYNTIEVARAKALGASSEAIDRLIQKQKELDVQSAFSAAKQARQNQILAQDALRSAIGNGDEDAIKQAEENLKTATEVYTKFNSDFDKAIIDAAVNRYSIQEKAHNKEVKANEDKNKAITDANKKAKEKDLADQKAYNESVQAGIKALQEANRNAEQEDIEAKVKAREDDIKNAEDAIEAIEAMEEYERELRQNAYDYQVEQKKNLAEQEMYYNMALVDSATAVLDNAIEIAGAETDLGKALLLSKQAVYAAELVLNIKSSIENARKVATDATVKSAGAGVDIATGAAKTASAAPFPANIPLILGYAASAIGIIASVKSALKKVPGAQGGGGEGLSAGASASVPASAAPTTAFIASSNNQLASSIATNQSTTPIKAYVVSKDVTTGQELDRNAINTGTIG